MGFSRDDTKMVKGFAIILMLYHHLFAFPNRIQDGSSYIPLLTFTNVDSAMLIGLFGKMCVALFLFLGGYGTWMSFQAKRDKQLLGQPKGTAASADLLSSFTLAKVKGLYTPYLKVFAIVVPIALILGDARVTATFESLFWNVTGLNITYNGEWWFFTDYLILLAAFPLMVRFFARKHATLSVDLLVVCVWNAAVTWIVPSLAQAAWASEFTHSHHMEEAFRDHAVVGLLPRRVPVCPLGLADKSKGPLLRPLSCMRGRPSLPGLPCLPAL